MRLCAWVAALLLTSSMAHATEPPEASPLAALPLVELPATGTDSRLAIIWSGDGGWRDLDKVIGEWLASQGIAAVGVDSLHYFWAEKPPEQVAADLAAIIEHYSTAWNRPDVLLVGYSFGADVLPFAYNRLPEPSRAKVRRLSLLALSTFADFEIHVSGWLVDGRHAGSKDTAPELARLAEVSVQCFYGADDTGTGCILPELKGAEIVRTTGGHHFDGDYLALAKRIVAGTR